MWIYLHKIQKKILFYLVKNFTNFIVSVSIKCQWLLTNLSKGNRPWENPAVVRHM